jgi:hypothetical protein
MELTPPEIEANRLMERRKVNYTVALANLKNSPLIIQGSFSMTDDIYPLMKYFTAEIGIYKYTEDGKNFFLAELQKHIAADLIYAKLLQKVVTHPIPEYPNGLTLFQAIAYYF